MLALDSGAHSIYNTYVVPKSMHKKKGVKGGAGKENINVQARIHSSMNMAHYRTPQFKKYVDDYIVYCHAHKKEFEFYVTMDAIFDAKESYEATVALEQSGLKPLPVVHYGEDLSWLKKYMDRYEYIGLGGLGQTVTRGNYFGFADAAFKLLCDGKGRPKYRVHGFAMGSFELMARYPWHSVDASSPFVHSRNGAVLVPKPTFKNSKHTGWDFLGQPKPIWVTARRNQATGHYEQLSPRFKALVNEYLSTLHLDVAAVEDNYSLRDYANMYFTYCVERAIQQQNAERFGDKWRFNYFISGKPSQKEDDFLATLPILAELGIESVKYLGTFFLPKPINKFLDYQKKAKHG